MIPAFDLAPALAAIRARTDVVSEIGIVLGSGMGALAERVQGVRIPYADVPGLVPSSVQSHAGEFVVGELAGRRVVVMSGRLHAYEGHSAETITRPVRVMAGLGSRTLVATNAAGGLAPEIGTGDLVLIEDHISLVNLTGGDALRGGAAEERFIALDGAYDAELLGVAETAAATLGEHVRRGVYFHAVGPSFETPAEVRLMRMMGGDVVGMSTVPEVVVARALGMRVLAISGVSNPCVAELNSGQHVTAEDAWAALEAIGPRMAALAEAVIEQLPN